MKLSRKTQIVMLTGPRELKTLNSGHSRPQNRPRKQRTPAARSFCCSQPDSFAELRSWYSSGSSESDSKNRYDNVTLSMWSNLMEAAVAQMT